MRVPNLEELSLGQRVVLTAVIVIVILLAMAFIGFSTGRWEAGAEGRIREPRAISIYDREMVLMEREAAQEAYKAHVQLLFKNWMADDKDQPERAIVGVRRAQRAYIAILTDLNRQEYEMIQQGK